MRTKQSNLTNKILICIMSFVFISFFLTACTGDKPSILFNKNPITEETVMDYSSLFKRNTRIYYLILIPKKIASRYIYIQVIKKGSQDRFGYSLYWANTVRLKDEQVSYYDDYIVINEKGTYVMKVFSKDNPTKPLTMAQFFVSD